MISGNIYALAVFENSALVNGAHNAVGKNLFGDDRDKTVVEKKLPADRRFSLAEEDID